MGGVWKSTHDGVLKDRIEKRRWFNEMLVTTTNKAQGNNNAFAASLDADSEGEGKYYVWTTTGWHLLGDNFSAFARDYRVTDAGNFPEGGDVNILNRLPPSLNNDNFEEEAQHAQSLDILARAQNLRTPPGAMIKPWPIGTDCDCCTGAAGAYFQNKTGWTS